MREGVLDTLFRHCVPYWGLRQQREMQQFLIAETRSWHY